MPPKAKQKPKPQPRRGQTAALSAVGENSANPVNLDDDDDATIATEPKEEPAIETLGLQLTETIETATSFTTKPDYSVPSLFIEDQSDEEDSPEPEDNDAGPVSAPPVIEAEFDGGKEFNDDDEVVVSDDDEDDDPVVQSYDIVINNTLEDLIHLFQYPVRSKEQPYTLLEGFAPVEARMKANSGVMELDIPINVDRNYDPQKGMQYGQALWKSKMQKSLRANGQLEARGEGADRRKRRRAAEDVDEDDDQDDQPTLEYMANFEDARRRGRVFNKQTLNAKMQNDDANYFVGLFQGGALHFTRLHGSLQLRPQFHHIDVMSEQERANQRALREMNNPSSAKPLEARAVNLTVKTATGDNRILSASEQLAKDLRQEEDEEWREIDWVDQDTDEAWQMFANVYKQPPVPLNNALGKEEYFKWCSAPVSSISGTRVPHNRSSK